MGLKIKKSEFESSSGLKDTDVVSSIESVVFNNKLKLIIIHWEITSSKGEFIGIFPQKIPFDFSNQTFVELLLQNSDALHELAMDKPFLPTPEGLKSFADFNAETIDVGLPTIE